MKKLNFSVLSENVNKKVEYDFQNNKIFGSAYYVYQKASGVFQKFFGLTSPKTNSKITDKTLFRLASMTKPITAVAVLILVDKGLLSLADPVSKYIKGFSDIHILTEENGVLCDKGKPQKIPTVLNLLTHTSGIGTDGFKMGMQTDIDKKSVESFIDFHLRTGLDFEPGSKQAYSPLAAFDVLVKIIEIVSEKDFFDFLREELLIPCDMVDTVFSPSDEQWSRMVSMHDKKDGESVIGTTTENCVFGEYPVSHPLSGAGLASTLSDYSNFALMLLNKGIFNGNRILSEETFSLLCTPHVSKKIMPGNTQWGLGVRVITEDSYKYLPVGTFGWSGAYGSHFWVDPQNELIAVYMKNSLFDGGAGNESAVNFEKAVNASLC